MASIFTELSREKVIFRDGPVVLKLRTSLSSQVGAVLIGNKAQFLSAAFNRKEATKLRDALDRWLSEGEKR